MWQEKGRSRLTGSAQTVTVPLVRKHHSVLAFFHLSRLSPGGLLLSRSRVSFTEILYFSMHRHVPLLPPVWLHQHLVDLLQPYDSFLISDGLQQG